MNGSLRNSFFTKAAKSSTGFVATMIRGQFEGKIMMKPQAHAQLKKKITLGKLPEAFVATNA